MSFPLRLSFPSPAAIRLFLSKRSSSACSSNDLLQRPRLSPKLVTSLLVAAPAVSPTSRRLPASENSFEKGGFPDIPAGDDARLAWTLKAAHAGAVRRAKSEEASEWMGERPP